MPATDGSLYSHEPASCAPQILRQAFKTALGRCPLAGTLIKSRRTHTETMPRRRRSSPSDTCRFPCAVVTLARLALTPRAQLAADNLFLRKQDGPLQEHRVKPRRPDPATRVILVRLSGLLDWRSILTVVKPDTLIRWHLQGWRLFWRWKSRPGRPPIPRDLQRLIGTHSPGESDMG